MHVLMLSIDDRAFEAGSEVRERLQAYGPLFESLRVIVFTRRDRQAAAIAPNTWLYPAPAAFSPFAFLAALRLSRRILRKTGRDTVVTSQDAFTNLVAFFLQRRFGLPVQVQIHTDFLAPAFRRESFKNYLRYLIYRWSVRRADCVRVVSERIRHSLLSAIRYPLSAPVVVLSVFVDAQKIADAAPAFDLRQRCPGAHPIILWVGRLTREKNPGLALEVMAEFVNELSKSLLVIVGDGPERERLKFKVKSLKLEHNVRLESWQQDLIPYYQGADALLVTSRYEGYGRMFIEAAASGLPIVTTPVGLVGEILKPGESVLIFRTIEEGVRALSHVLRNHELGGHLTKAAREAVALLPDLPNYLARFRASFSNCRRSG